MTIMRDVMATRMVIGIYHFETAMKRKPTIVPKGALSLEI